MTIPPPGRILQFFISGKSTYTDGLILPYNMLASTGDMNILSISAYHNLQCLRAEKCMQEIAIWIVYSHDELARFKATHIILSIYM